MRIKLPPVNSPRRPIAFKYDPDVDKVFFIFPERTEVFLLQGNDSSLFWHKHCRECSLLYLGQCSGGNSYPRGLVNRVSPVYCYQNYAIQTTTIPVVGNLTNHVLSFNLSSSSPRLSYPSLYFLVEDDGLTYLYPYLIGNISVTGSICTVAKMNRDLEAFLDTLFAAKWNGDHSYWLAYTGSRTYTFDVHANWLKKPDYKSLMGNYSGRIFSLENAYLIEEEEYIEFD